MFDSQVKPQLKIIINLNVPHRKSKWTLRERTVMQDGVLHIRPLRNGEPGGTDKEVADAIAEFERACRAKAKDYLDTADAPQIDLYAKMLGMFDCE